VKDEEGRDGFFLSRIAAQLRGRNSKKEYI
jgi:hypothetical protein